MEGHVSLLSSNDYWTGVNGGARVHASMMKTFHTLCNERTTRNTLEMSRSPHLCNLYSIAEPTVPRKAQFILRTLFISTHIMRVPHFASPEQYVLQLSWI